MTAVFILEFFYLPCCNYLNSLKIPVEEIILLPVVSYVYVIFACRNLNSFQIITPGLKCIFVHDFLSCF